MSMIPKVSLPPPPPPKSDLGQKLADTDAGSGSNAMLIGSAIGDLATLGTAVAIIGSTMEQPEIE